MSARLSAAAALAALVISCSSSPAYADVPPNVTSGPHGVVDAGWVRVACAVSDDGARCSLRYPEGMRRSEVAYTLGGHDLGIETLWDRDTPGRARDRLRTMAGLVAPGVRVSCTTIGATSACTLALARRYRDFNVVTYSAGVGLGGLRGEGIVL